MTKQHEKDDADSPRFVVVQPKNRPNREERNEGRDRPRQVSDSRDQVVYRCEEVAVVPRAGEPLTRTVMKENNLQS